MIDLDLLCYGNLKINKRNLIIPHPRLHIRKFVIKPICDINPQWRHPILKTKAINLCTKIIEIVKFEVKNAKFRAPGAKNRGLVIYYY